LTWSFLPGYLGRRITIIVIYVAYLLISVVPEPLYATNSSSPDKYPDIMGPGLPSL
jgi:hypothetical protein